MVAKNTVANTQQKRLSIGIVGGGIGGVAFAVALSRDSQLMFSFSKPLLSSLKLVLGFLLALTL